MLASTPISFSNTGMVTYTQTKGNLIAELRSVSSKIWTVRVKIFPHLTGLLEWTRTIYNGKKTNLTDVFWRRVSFIAKRLSVWTKHDASLGSWYITCDFRVFICVQTCWVIKNSLGFSFHEYDLLFFSGLFQFKFLKPSMSFWQSIWSPLNTPVLFSKGNEMSVR